MKWKSFIKGMGSIFGSYVQSGYPKSEDTLDALREDQKRIGEDWRAVGDDLRRAMLKYHEEQLTEEQKEEMKDIRERLERELRGDG